MSKRYKSRQVAIELNIQLFTIGAAVHIVHKEGMRASLEYGTRGRGRAEAEGITVPAISKAWRLGLPSWE
ncbi:hypothetical protein BC938DRAFT_478203 [Jimgerdemannia flammicorona]|uniref:Uncharacterized protein n=1 Tax=Jimgerdemannia flammicorona TaxID=994334 RepID=A0A433QYK0_9FUNG|nr:hypothetical protein BC938DRAFT_478203 [Jimgerdemannia flammicorona]